MWRMLLPNYLLFLISIILFLKTDIRILSASEASNSLGCSMINREVYIYILEKWFPLWGERAQGYIMHVHTCII